MNMGFPTTDEQACYPRPGQRRALEARHLSTCHDPRCRGCQPCTKSHCSVCHEQHTDTVCTPCVADTREDLHALVELYLMAGYHVGYAGRDGRLVAAQEMPGGNAVVLIGPSARDDILTERRVWTSWHHNSDPFLTPEDELDSDPEPIAYTLGTWELWYRTAMALPPPPARPRVRRAFDFLDDRLADLVKVTKPKFADFAADLRLQRLRVEDELLAGEREAKSAVDCDHCDVSFIRKYAKPRPGRCSCPRWIPHSRDVPHTLAGTRVLPDPSATAGAAAMIEAAERTARLASALWSQDANHGPQTVSCVQCHRDQVHQAEHLRDQGGLPDDWVCPKCGRGLTDGQYKESLARDYRDNAEYLPGDLLEERTGIKAATIRKWASRGQIRRQGKDGNGRTLYSVYGALRRREHEARRCGCPNIRRHASHLREGLCCILCHIDQHCPLLERHVGLREMVAS